MKKIEKISKDEVTDRSTSIRKLIYLGYQDFIKKKVAEDYVKGLITISKAAENAELTIWEMENFLIKQGHKSEYSIEDLKRELDII